MNAKDAASDGLRLIPRLAGAIVAVPMVAGFIALGAAVLIGRSLLDVAGKTWSRLPSLRGRQRDEEPEKPKAA